MVQLESEKKVKRRCCGFGSKIQTAVLPDGGTTTEFQNWRVSFGTQKPKRSKTKVIGGAGAARIIVRGDDERTRLERREVNRSWVNSAAAATWKFCGDESRRRRGPPASKTGSPCGLMLA